MLSNYDKDIGLGGLGFRAWGLLEFQVQRQMLFALFLFVPASKAIEIRIARVHIMMITMMMMKLHC